MPEGAVPAGTVLAFDYGEKRIGVAVGESLLRSAHPLTVIHAHANDERFAAIAALIAEWRPVRLVVGMPGKVIRTQDRIKSIHAQAIKYKTEWAVYYGVKPDIGGEIYKGEKII